MKNWDPSLGREARRREFTRLLNKHGGSMSRVEFETYLKGRGYVVKPLMAALARLGLIVEGDTVMLLEESVGGGFTSEPGPLPPPKTGADEEAMIEDVYYLAKRDLSLMRAIRDG